jgi:UDP-glucose 4-epimerase
MKPLRIAVTGGRGRLAPLVADHLRVVDSKVVSFSRSDGDNFRPITLLTEPRTIADFDVILHLGWSTVPLTSEERPGLEQATDLPLLHDMLDACAAIRRPPHLVFFSTAAVYGNTKVPATEEAPCRPLGRYARAKLLAEEVIRSACERNSSLRCSILRISNIFGWITTSKQPQGIISRICRAIHEERPIPLWGDGENTKDYLFLTDLLDAVQTVVTRGETGTFNVASEKSLSVNDIISLVESFTGKKLLLARYAAFPWDVECSYISARKLRRATGWHARHDLVEAIRELAEAELKCV